MNLSAYKHTRKVKTLYPPLSLRSLGGYKYNHYNIMVGKSPKSNFLSNFGWLGKNAAQFLDSRIFSADFRLTYLRLIFQLSRIFRIFS